MAPGSRIIRLTDAVWQRDPALRAALDGGLLMDFLRTRRWFAGKSAAQTAVFLAHDDGTMQPHWLIGWTELQQPGVEPQDYLLPLGLTWIDEAGGRLAALQADALATVVLNGRTGLVHDAFADDRFCRNLVKMIVRGAKVQLSGGWLKCAVTGAFADLVHECPEQWSLRRLDANSSNTLIAVGDRLLLKIYRRLQPGLHPELEIGRFLTDVAAFPHAAPLIGALEYENEEEGAVTTLALLQGFVPHQEDGWNYTQDVLKRLLADSRQPQAGADGHAPYLRFARTLGRRTGELHRALAQAAGDPAFDPEPMTATDWSGWRRQIRREAEAALDRLESVWRQFPPPARSLAKRVLKSRAGLMAQLDQLGLETGSAMKIRTHGDLHLGQVLVAGDEVILIDFEGEPARPLAERREKHLPLRDVAGMLRSFSYAAHAALHPLVETPALACFAANWEQQAGAAFLAGYAETADPGNAAHAIETQSLLKLCLLEKACYELRYELDNRPDWIAIPLGGLRKLLSLSLKDEWQ